MTKDPKSFEQVDQWKTTMFLYSSALKSINTKIEILNNESSSCIIITPSNISHPG